MLKLFKALYLHCKRRNILKRSIIICKIVRGELPEWKKSKRTIKIQILVGLVDGAYMI